MPCSRCRSQSWTSSTQRSSLSSVHDTRRVRQNVYRIHIAELPRVVHEDEIRKSFQRYGTLTGVWIASGYCSGFVVYKKQG